MPESRNRAVLILGGTGIIGRRLAVELSKRGDKVSVLSRGLTTAADLISDHNVECITGDFRDECFRNSAFRSRHFDAVVDLLSFTPLQLEQTLSVFAGRCGQYVFVSSATVFEGNDHSLPITELSRLKNGPWDYPKQKISSEQFLRDECARTGQSFVIVRPYITYSDTRVPFGPWETQSILSRLTAGMPVVLGANMAGTQTSLTHTDDLAAGIAVLVGAPEANNEDFIIASEEVITWAEVYETVASVLGVRLDLRLVPDVKVLRAFPELRGKISDRLSSRTFNVDKLRRIDPDFRFKYSVSEGLKEIVPGIIARGKLHQDPATLGALNRLLIDVEPNSETRATVSDFNKAHLVWSTKTRLQYILGQHPKLQATLRNIKHRLQPHRKSETY